MTTPAEKAWNRHVDGGPRHVWPANDNVQHNTDDDEGNCICGPRVEPVEGLDGHIGWLIIHHSLDDREAYERAARERDTPS